MFSSLGDSLMVNSSRPTNESRISWLTLICELSRNDKVWLVKSSDSWLFSTTLVVDIFFHLLINLMKYQTNSSSAFFRAILPVATIAVATLLKVVCMLAQQKLSHLKIQVSMHVQGVTSTATTGCPNKFLVKISNIAKLDFWIFCKKKFVKLKGDLHCLAWM